MNRHAYKQVLDQIKPDADLCNRLAQNMHHQNPRPVQKKRVRYVMASLIVVVMIAIAVPQIWKNANFSPADRSANHEQTAIHTATPGAITIPKIELPKEFNAQADMVGLIVYKGNIYTQTSTHISPENLKLLLGEKLGRTKGNIDEWSKQSDYNELASTIGITDIYSVKGYNSDFRIMSFLEQDGQVYAELYEHLNGITVAKGEELIGKTKVKEQLQSVRWQDYSSWYYSKEQFNSLPTDEIVQTFLTALYEAKPIDGDKLYKEGIYDNGESNQKVIFFKLKDQTEVQMWMFKGNYVHYAGAPVFFQLEPSAFSALWDRM